MMYGMCITLELDGGATSMTTDTTSDTGRLTIDGLLVDGKYRTRESYTEAQIEEILDIAEKAGKAALRYVNPDMVDQLVVERLNGDTDARG